MSVNTDLFCLKPKHHIFLCCTEGEKYFNNALVAMNAYCIKRADIVETTKYIYNNNIIFYYYCDMLDAPFYYVDRKCNPCGVTWKLAQLFFTIRE